MRIKQLGLEAFGPFQGEYLEFSEKLPDFHIIYGPNEAGKSSILRALNAWLFGFPERTRDNFIHPNEQLRLAGVLEDGHGEELFFVRRKKRKASVLDSQGNPIDSGAIKAFLLDLDQDVFDKLFGLDHQALVQGGITFLQEKGRAGTTLFSAGTGISALQKILTDLQTESEAIFKKNATKPSLNSALQSFKQLKQEMNRASLSSREYKELDRAFRQTEKSLEQEQKKRLELSREKHRLERIQQAWYPLQRYRNMQNRLKQIGNVPELSEDFSQRRKQHQEQSRQARQSLKAAQKQLQDYQDRVESIRLNTELLDQAETIKELHQRLGQYRKAMADRPILEGKRVQEKTVAGNILRKIRPDMPIEQITTLRPLLQRRRGVNEYGGKLPLLEHELQTAQKKLDNLVKNKQKTLASLERLPAEHNCLPLRQTIERASRLGSIDNELNEQNQSLKQKRSVFSSGLNQIGLWQGFASDFLELQLPLEETVHSFAETQRQFDEEGRLLSKHRQSLQQEHKRLTREIKALEKTGDVPTETELNEQRARRDQGWSLLKRQWLESEDVSLEASQYHPELTLAEAYEQQILLTDAIADRLRREGERVHKYAHLQAELEQAIQDLTCLEQEEAALSQKYADHQYLWQQAWQPSGIAPLPPTEMAHWMSKIANLRLQAQQIIDLEEKISTMTIERQNAITLLVTELTNLQEETPQGEELTPYLRLAQSILKQAEENQTQRQRLQQQLTDLEDEISQATREVHKAEDALSKWWQQWQEILAELGLSDHELPVGVADFFEELNACLNHLDRAEDFQKRIQGIERDAEQFTQEVRNLLQRVAPDLAALPVDQAIERINGLLTRSREEEATLSTYREGIEQSETEIRQASADLEAAATELDRLCGLSGCQEHEELETVEKRWQEKISLESQMQDEEKGLIELAAGQTIAELESQSQEVDPDTLPGHIQTCAEELEQVNQRTNELNQLVGEQRKELQRMDGSALAAQKAEQAEEKLSEIHRLAEQYARLRIATKVLEDEIERYRAENQDPILAIASSYFAQLTLNSFDGLRTDLDDKGGQIIVGLRNGGERVPAEGMSSGTRDQLFFALRLASLEYRLEYTQAMPFIVDDILINFDEDRSRAALQALNHLSQKNQVLLFSHHKHVAEMAESLCVGQIHNL
jgi:uncharacterized protein YhaN